MEPTPATPVPERYAPRRLTDREREELDLLAALDAELADRGPDGPLPDATPSAAGQ
jgi:hypothetical protein